jgi:hypothetical protein
MDQTEGNGVGIAKVVPEAKTVALTGTIQIVQGIIFLPQGKKS